MRNMRRWLCALLTAALAAAVPALALGEALGERDETVYAMLDGSGAVQSVSAVVRADVAAGEYEDVGGYASVKSLSGADVSLADGRVRISMPADGALYYQGDLAGAELPWNIALSVEKDGVALSAEDAAGQPGAFAIRLTIEKNEKADPWFAQNLTLQAQVSVDLDAMRVLSCAGATCAVTGSAMTVAYNVLPGGALDARIEVETDRFALAEITVTALRSEMTIDGVDQIAEKLKGLGEGRQGGEYADMDMETVRGLLGQLADAGAQLTDGSQTLYDGVSQIKTEGVSEAYLKVLASQKDSADTAAKQTGILAQSLLDLTDGMEQLQSGFGQFNDGLAQYADGVTQIANTASELLNALEEQETLMNLIGSLSGEQVYAPKSFAGAEGALRSVQFVMRTAAIAPVPETVGATAVPEESTLLSRFKAIFGQ